MPECECVSVSVCVWVSVRARDAALLMAAVSAVVDILTVTVMDHLLKLLKLPTQISQTNRRPPFPSLSHPHNRCDWLTDWWGRLNAQTTMTAQQTEGYKSVCEKQILLLLECCALLQGIRITICIYFFPKTNLFFADLQHISLCDNFPPTAHEKPLKSFSFAFS